MDEEVGYSFSLLNERRVYLRELPLEYAWCGQTLGVRDEATRIADLLLADASLPAEARQAARKPKNVF